VLSLDAGNERPDAIANYDTDEKRDRHCDQLKARTRECTRVAPVFLPTPSI
jgi:hypothetical protein